MTVHNTLPPDCPLSGIFNGGICNCCVRKLCVSGIFRIRLRICGIIQRGILQVCCHPGSNTATLLCPLQTSAVCPLRAAALYYALREPPVSHKYTERPNRRPVLSLYSKPLFSKWQLRKPYCFLGKIKNFFLSDS